jgi:3-oxoacyl-[acyl-carrier protein] reductase
MSPPVTLITGTRKGIGKFLCEYYVNLGHIVIGCSREKPEWEIPGYTHFLADVADEKEVKKIFTTIRQSYGGLNILINNAGIASMNHSLLTPLSTVSSILNTNILGTFLFSREAAKLMRINRSGRIVNFTTVAIPLKLEGEAIYAASKSAVLTLTEILAREFANDGITVNSIGPTPIATDLTKFVPKEKMDQLVSRQTIHRFGVFEDIANVVDFFIKPESSFITGQNIYLGGL